MQFPYFGTSHYDALQVVVKHSFKHDLGFLVSYAWQKTMSTNDSELYYGNGSQDVYNRKLERSVAPFDKPQSLKLDLDLFVAIRKGQAVHESGRPRESGPGRLDRYRHPELPVRRRALD